MEDLKETLDCSMSSSFCFSFRRSEAFWSRRFCSDSFEARSLMSRVWEEMGRPNEWSMDCLMKSSISGGRDMVVVVVLLVVMMKIEKWIAGSESCRGKWRLKRCDAMVKIQKFWNWNLRSRWVSFLLTPTVGLNFQWNADFKNIDFLL